MRPLALALLLVACGGGGGSDPDPRPDCFVGRTGAAPAITAVLFRGEGEEVLEATPGGEIHLVEPPQGGYVIFAGPRVTGVCPEDLRVRGRLLRAGEVLWDEERTRLDYVVKGEEAEPAWPRISEYPNLLACPTFETFGLEGEPVRLELTVVDRAGRTATAAVEGVARCRQADLEARALCACICGPDYQVGSCP